MTFVEFGLLAASRGLAARDCGGGHWRIEGGVQSVNYYPQSRKRSIYINGTEDRIPFSATPELAIAAALGELGRVHSPRGPSGFKRKKLRNHLLRKDPHCFSCKKVLTQETATLDHIIPLAKGGTNAATNFQLACEPCNVKKGDSL